MSEQDLIFWLKGITSQDPHKIDLQHIKKMLNTHLVDRTTNYSFTKGIYDHNLQEIPQISFDDR